MQVNDSLYLLGIRHHGPGSAASLLNALQTIEPDIILLEGAPEADSIIELAGHKSMQPPVAQLIYAVDNPANSVYYPFTEFSPEWQCIRFALNNAVPLRFFDLPQTHSFALTQSQQQKQEHSDDANIEDGEMLFDEDGVDDEESEPEENIVFRQDPLDLLAHAAGFADGERWWEYVVESRNNDLEVFTGIGEAMATVRQSIEAEYDQSQSLPYLEREVRREAWMRKSIRKAQKEGFQRIAAVCGAWHVPALARKVAVKDDNAVLKGLPKVKVKATWVPWTHSRISSASGYGAGVSSPGWYHHLWQYRVAEDSAARARNISVSWLAKVAHLLREEGIDVSAANVIESVRLTETLAALRERPLPGLEELNESVMTTFCFGDDTPLKLIERKLIVGEILGEVPDETPTVPLQQDLQRLQKRLRLKPEAVEKDIELDLRQATGLGRSQLLHRLNLLDLPWGQFIETGSGKGTFKERWRLQWQPEFAVKLIEAAVWGNTVASAAEQATRHALQETHALADITRTIDRLLLADLPTTVAFAVQRLQTEAAIASDVGQLMAALPALARIIRYSDVRNTDTSVLQHVLDGLCIRICMGLAGACSSLDADAASAMLSHINAAHDALQLLQDEQRTQEWQQALMRLADQRDLHGLIAGRSCRLLLNAEKLAAEEVAQRLQFALSLGNEPDHAAHWLEGLLSGSGVLLLHDDRLWQIVDDWLSQLDADTFLQLLPLLRRTFSSFQFGERQQMFAKVKQGESSQVTRINVDTAHFDKDKAEACLPLVSRLLGLGV